MPVKERHGFPGWRQGRIIDVQIDRRRWGSHHCAAAGTDAEQRAVVLVLWHLVLVIRIYLVQKSGSIASEHNHSIIATGYCGEGKKVTGENDYQPTHCA